MKAKVKKIIAILIGIGLCVLLFYTYSEFNGNPITKIYARQQINTYLKDHHTQLDYNKSKTYYNFKDGSYYVGIDVLDSEDHDFTVEYIRGEVKDDYQFRVEERQNVASRLQIYLNEEQFEKPMQDLFKENCNFSLITFDDNEFENNLPELDIPLEELLTRYKLEMSLYLNDISQYSSEDLVELEKEIIQIYKELGINIEKVKISD